ncbi:MAG: hypothetical protein ABIK96_10545 [bacterium]
MKTVTILAAVLVLATLGGCKDDDPFDEGADRARLAAMEAAIDDFIGEPLCGDASECRAAPFGAKPCGGPWTYKVFNATAVDTVVLYEMIAEYDAYNEVLNQRYGWNSDCMFVEAPALDCLDGRCVPVSMP